MENLKYSFRSLLVTVSIACLVFFTGCATADSLQLTALTVEGRDTLLGTDIPKPRFAWKLQSAERDLHQTAFHLLVSSTHEKLDKNEGDIWDSEKVASDASINIEYNGKPLTSYQSYFWKVKVTTNKGDEVWSKPSYWSVGLLDSADWKAKWIGLDGFNEKDAPDSTFTRLSARYLRNEFPLAKKVESATAFVSGMGLYELYINGNKVGSDVLAPTVSEYNKRIYYNTYDVTPLVQEGKNCAAVVLGNGRYFGVRNYHGQPDPLTQIPQTHYGLPRLLLQIRVVYNDGSTELITSNEQWKVTDQGPIVANNEFDGEEYDATKELTGWNKTGYNDASWKPVNLMPPAAKQLAAQPNENIRIKEVLQPVNIIKTSRGTHILDMGQNMVGWIAIKVKGERGDTVKMRFAETMKGEDSI